MIDRYLSIWEIAHRWRDVNPDKTDPADLPLNIQDTIRYLCRGVLNGGLHVFYLVTEETLAPDNRHGFTSEVRAYHVNEFPADLSESLSRKYDKDILDGYVVEAENLFDYCLHDQCTGLITTVDFPSCWGHLINRGHHNESQQKDFDYAQVQPLPLPPNRIDKRHRIEMACQQIGIMLWKKNPQFTNKEIAISNEVQHLGGGSEYELETVQIWLSEIDPRDSSKKRGRKRKNNSGSINPDPSQPPEN